MAEKFVYELDEYLGIEIRPMEREASPDRVDRKLAQASIVFLAGPFKDMQVSGFFINQGDRQRYVTGPSHWWKNDDVTGEASTNKQRKAPRIEFFRSTDEGLRGIPQRVQEDFLRAYDAHCQAAALQ
jgi:hypothetical protein